MFKIPNNGKTKGKSSVFNLLFGNYFEKLKIL
jgi:hypothetical protein